MVRFTRMDKKDLMRVMHVALHGPHNHVSDAPPEAVRHCVDMGWVHSVDVTHLESPPCGEFIITGITPAGREWLNSQVTVLT